MHIVFTATEFISEGICRGPESYLSNISTILADRGHQITIIVLSNRIETIKWKENITIIRITISKGRIFHEFLKNTKSNELHNIAYVLDVSLAFKEKIREINLINPIDIVEARCHGYSFYRCKDIPLVVRISSFLPDLRIANQKEYHECKNAKELLLSEKFAIYSTIRADAVYAPSVVVSRKMENFIRKRVNVVESPAYLVDIDDSLYNKYCKGKKYLIYYGSLRYLKGVHIIAEVISIFLEKHQEYYFLFVGSSSKIEYEGKRITMTELIQIKAGKNIGRVMFMDNLQDKKQLFGLVKHAYACILPSRVDNLPNTCIESMALGKIVIGTRGASFEQLITDKKNGLLIEKESPESLFDALEYLLNMSADEIAYMEKYATNTIKRLSPDIVYRNFLNLYTEVIEKKNKKSFLWKGRRLIMIRRRGKC